MFSIVFEVNTESKCNTVIFKGFWKFTVFVIKSDNPAMSEEFYCFVLICIFLFIFI